MDATQDRFCRACGYSLRALPEPRCPECGTEFNPDDPLTFTTRTRPSSLICWFSRPLGWQTHSLAALAVVLSFWAGSVPGSYFGVGLFGILAWAVLGAVWLLRLAIRFAIVKYYGKLEESGVGVSRSWMLAPLLFLLTLLAIWTRAPRYLGFFISRPAMERLVKEATTISPGTRLSDRWIGLYAANDIEVIPNGVQFFVKEAGFLDRNGFAYSSKSNLRSLDGRSYYPLFGKWYRVHENW